MIKEILLIISSISFITFIYFGLYIFLLSPRQKLNRMFLYFSLSFALWSLGNIFLNLPLPADLIAVWQRVTYAGASVYFVFVLRFTLILTDYDKKIRNRVLFNIIIWILPAVLLFFNFTENAIIRDFPTGFWYLSLHVTANLIYNAPSLVLATVWAARSKLKREKKQGFIIAAGALSAIVIGLIADFFFGGLGIPSPTCSIVLIWIFSVWYVMVKYRFFKLTIQMVAKDIVTNISDLVFLIDIHLNILFYNTKAAVLAGKGKTFQEGESFMRLVEERVNVHEKLEKLIKNDFAVFSSKLNLVLSHDARVLTDARFSQIKDGFGDLLGILVIAREVKGIERLRAIYGVSDREIEVVRHALTGSTNKQIAGRLNITERTVKNHLTNVYNKMGIDNKVELLNLVLEV